MSSPDSPPPGDQARVSVRVDAPPELAFRIFTEEIDAWWRHGRKYRVAGTRRSILCVEPGVGGRLFESFETSQGTRVVETGRILAWEPPSRLLFEWRNVNFAPSEKTEVEVLFASAGEGTLVTVVHRGWSRIRPDHPARHGRPPAPFLRMMGLWWGDLLTSLRQHAASR